MNQDIVVQLIPVLAPVLIAIAIGYAWAKLGRDFDVRFLANMIHNVGMPCLIFSTLTKVDVDPEVFVDMAWASVATHLAFLIIGAFVLRAARLPLSVYLNGMVYPNAGNIGLPLCLFAFGELGLALSTAWFTIDSVMVATLGVWVASGRFTMGDLMRAPLLYAALGAVMFLASGTKPPVWLANTTGLIGGLAIPLLLVMLGVSLGTLRVANLRRAFLLSLLRLGMGFVIGVVAADLFAFDGVERGVLIINCALSVGMVNYLISQYYDREPQEVAAIVVVSGFISIATLPLLVAYVL
ncbi:MAG: AEC family transporter [Alphaproteobacteria bacterium]|nr:AEC family transporter [Alphaproteobacteria bacterium]MCY4498731.1 AEC family transporter [Rhodospirillaceae bacterium]